MEISGSTFPKYLDLGVVDTMRIEVTGSLNVNIKGHDAQAWRISEHSEGSIPPRYAWLRSLTSEGVHLIGGISDTDTLLTERIEYKYPAAVGNSGSWRGIFRSRWPG